jgi:N-ethylmaleimide reductase
MKPASLFERYRLGSLDLKNRIVMAPMTRARSLQPGNIPSALMAEYYRQRASAGLIITEATQISPQGQGYSWTPGIHSPEQVSGWQLTTGPYIRRAGSFFSALARWANVARQFSPGRSARRPVSAGPGRAGVGGE